MCSHSVSIISLYGVINYELVTVCYFIDLPDKLIIDGRTEKFTEEDGKLIVNELEKSVTLTCSADDVSKHQSYSWLFENGTVIESLAPEKLHITKRNFLNFHDQIIFCRATAGLPSEKIIEKRVHLLINHKPSESSSVEILGTDKVPSKFWELECRLNHSAYPPPNCTWLDENNQMIRKTCKEKFSVKDFNMEKLTCEVSLGRKFFGRAVSPFLKKARLSHFASIYMNITSQTVEKIEIECGASDDPRGVDYHLAYQKGDDLSKKVDIKTLQINKSKFFELENFILSDLQGKKLTCVQYVIDDEETFKRSKSELITIKAPPTYKDSIPIKIENEVTASSLDFTIKRFKSYPDFAKIASFTDKDGRNASFPSFLYSEPDSVKIKRQNLVLKGLSIEHTGNYTLILQNSQGKSEPFEIEIVINSRPDISTPPELTRIGDTFKCVSKGYPLPRIEFLIKEDEKANVAAYYRSKNPLVLSDYVTTTEKSKTAVIYQIKIPKNDPRFHGSIACQGINKLGKGPESKTMETSVSYAIIKETQNNYSRNFYSDSKTGEKFTCTYEKIDSRARISFKPPGKTNWQCIGNAYGETCYYTMTQYEQEYSCEFIENGGSVQKYSRIYKKESKPDVPTMFSFNSAAREFHLQIHEIGTNSNKIDFLFEAKHVNSTGVIKAKVSLNVDENISKSIELPLEYQALQFAFYEVRVRLRNAKNKTSGFTPFIKFESQSWAAATVSRLWENHRGLFIAIGRSLII